MIEEMKTRYGSILLIAFYRARAGQNELPRSKLIHQGERVEDVAGLATSQATRRLGFLLYMIVDFY